MGKCYPKHWFVIWCTGIDRPEHQMFNSQWCIISLRSSLQLISYLNSSHIIWFSLSDLFFALLGRILLDIPCKVCRDHSSGKHYGIFACDGFVLILSLNWYSFCQKYYKVYQTFVRKEAYDQEWAWTSFVRFNTRIEFNFSVWLSIRLWFQNSISLLLWVLCSKKGSMLLICQKSGGNELGVN